MSAGKLARNEAWNCVPASCAWHPRTWAGISCPANNKISLSNKFYVMPAGTLARVPTIVFRTSYSSVSSTISIFTLADSQASMAFFRVAPQR